MKYYFCAISYLEDVRTGYCKPYLPEAVLGLLHDKVVTPDKTKTHYGTITLANDKCYTVHLGHCVID